ncbi:MAG: amidohydrolase family protein [Planctomycetes bacterium]|nr:amidohydrolase family protein [Planctomycetota bacterium]
MSLVLKNALLCDIDPIGVEAGDLRIDAGLIAERGRVATTAGDEVVDCGGAVVLPGLVNGHTHIYSALAVGMPPSAIAPTNFHEILKYVWWRLDQALDAESIEMSARIAAIQALRCGTTTLIDHHASPNWIGGSLDLIEKALSEVGPRGVLCYETTDRHGKAGREAGLQENRRYAEKCRAARNGRFAGLIGAHASFTLDDDALTQLAVLSKAIGAGVHIHVAEDPCDETDAKQRGASSLIDRLAANGLVKAGNIFAHGTHLDARAVEAVNSAGLTMAHNSRSNMNNAVGYAPVAGFRVPVMLGTDGIGADMFAEAQSAWYISRHQKAGFGPARILDMLAASARRASAALGVTLGKLQMGAAADIVITDYRPFTELTTDNLPGHFIWGLSSNHVRHVLMNGEWRLRDRTVVSAKEGEICDQSREVGKMLWERMSVMR